MEKRKPFELNGSAKDRTRWRNIDRQRRPTMRVIIKTCQWLYCLVNDSPVLSMMILSCLWSLSLCLVVVCSIMSIVVLSCLWLFYYFSCRPIFALTVTSCLCLSFPRLWSVLILSVIAPSCLWLFYLSYDWPVLSPTALWYLWLSRECPSNTCHCLILSVTALSILWQLSFSHWDNTGMREQMEKK